MWPLDRLRERKSHKAPNASIDSRPTATVERIGHRRRDCWWEPIFAPNLTIDPTPYEWDFGKSSGPVRRFIAGTSLHSQMEPGDTFKVEDLTFKECDFQGTFHATPLVMFTRCRFVRCDFAYSIWKNAHFKDCLFEECSFSLASFDKCDFRECTWRRIGIASKTDFTRSFINNPESLIQATISRNNPNDRTWRHALNQWYRLKGTRAHFLRSVMLSHQTTGDEHIYYETVKLHELRRSTARMSEDIFGIIFADLSKKLQSLIALILHGFDYILLRCFGSLNGWGESVSRPCSVLGICYLTFALIYKYANFAAPITTPFQKSFDLTFLVGYGNQVEKSDSSLSLIQDLHTIIAISIYSVFFSTVISKLSRAR